MSGFQAPGALLWGPGVLPPEKIETVHVYAESRNLVHLAVHIAFLNT